MQLHVYAPKHLVQFYMLCKEKTAIRSHVHCNINSLYHKYKDYMQVFIILLFVNSISRKQSCKLQVIFKISCTCCKVFCSDHNKNSITHEALKQSADTHDLMKIEKCQTIRLEFYLPLLQFID